MRSSVSDGEFRFSLPPSKRVNCGKRNRHFSVTIYPARGRASGRSFNSVNCRHVQDALSPYIDGRLTGRQMLEIQEHLGGCRSCAGEFLMIREAKTLLRSLPIRTPSASFEREIRRQALLDPSRIPLLVSPSSWSPPPRGRRLATALALSCVGIFVVAAPFGSGTVELTASRPLSLSALGHFEQKHDLLDARNLFAPFQSSAPRDVTFVSLKPAIRKRGAQPQNTDLFLNTAPGAFSTQASAQFGGAMTSFASFNR